MAITEAPKEAKRFKFFVGDISSCSKDVLVYCDSKSVIHLAKNQKMFHIRTKHVNVKYNIIRNVIDKNELTSMKNCTEENDSSDV